MSAVSSNVYKCVGVASGEPLPAYTSIGMYTILYATDRGEAICAKCATSYDNEDDPITMAGTYDEGEPLYCNECNCEIESSYGAVSE